MNGNKKPGRAFRLSPEAQAFVAEAKVQTPNSTASHRTMPHSAALYGTAPGEVVPHWQELMDGDKHINVKLTPELYAMALWCSTYAPSRPSLNKILRAGCEVICREMIEKHSKPEREE